MDMTIARMASRGVLTIIAPALLASCNLGCATATKVPFRADRYRIDLRIDPETSNLVGRTAIDLRRESGFAPSEGPIAIEFALHPNLKVSRVTAGGTSVVRRSFQRPATNNNNEFSPTKHLVVLNESVDAVTLVIDYAGILAQNVGAGEIDGQIHNFDMRAHIGTDGIYLADGYWYPEPVGTDDRPPNPKYFTLAVEPVPGFELVASGERDNSVSERTGRLTWSTPYGVDGMVLVGGPHEIHHTTHRGVSISVHLKPTQAIHATGLLDAVRRNLDRYVPLIGPYPAAEYSIVDNFFSSGFAFPTFTLLSSAVIEMGQRSQTAHGYIDHEMLHSWWGNGILVDPRDGNWCEALTSYATNYYGYVLDGNQDEARRKRRNYSHFLSRLTQKRNKPLGTYGQPDGCGRGIAYHKGAAVFHMLARKMGQDRFWAAMRRFTDQYLGRHASWNDIRYVCEEESGIDLDMFFNQWVRSAHAPSIRIDSARYDSAEEKLILALSQDEPPLELNLPIRIAHTGGHLDIDVPLRESSEEITLAVNVVPLSVELDPDYHVFRKVPLKQIVPTTASTRYGTAFTSVLPGGEVAEDYRKLQESFASSFEDDERTSMTPDELSDGALAERCVLILGDAVRAPYVAAFLSAIEFPVRWVEDGFELSGVTYTDPGDAVLCTTQHPGVPGGGVTVVFANSDEAIPKPMNVPMYDHSLVIFQNREPSVRLDFEQSHPVPVETR